MSPMDLMFPRPRIRTDRVNDSPALTSLVSAVTVRLNLPTAPLKSSGFPSAGSGSISRSIGLLLATPSLPPNTEKGSRLKRLNS